MNEKDYKRFLELNAQTQMCVAKLSEIYTELKGLGFSVEKLRMINLSIIREFKDMCIQTLKQKQPSAKQVVERGQPNFLPPEIRKEKVKK